MRIAFRLVLLTALVLIPLSAFATHPGLGPSVGAGFVDSPSGPVFARIWFSSCEGPAWIRVEPEGPEPFVWEGPGSFHIAAPFADCLDYAPGQVPISLASDDGSVRLDGLGGGAHLVVTFELAGYAAWGPAAFARGVT